MHSADVAILGAGMVGVSAALHLQARGRDVVLIDRHGAAGLETSFGNAGLIERASMFPYLFPRDPKKLALYALNLLPEAHYHLSALPGVAPWLWRYFKESAPDRAARSSAALRPLIQRCLIEHEALIEAARVGDLLRKTGWIKLYRSEKTMAAGAADAERLRDFGLNIDTLDARGVSGARAAFDRRGRRRALSRRRLGRRSEPPRASLCRTVQTARRALFHRRRPFAAGGGGRALERRHA